MRVPGKSGGASTSIGFGPTVIAVVASLLLAMPVAASLAAGQRHSLTIGITQFPVDAQPEHRCDGGQELCARHGAAAVHRLRRRLEARLPALHRAAVDRERPRRAGRLPSGDLPGRQRKGVDHHLHDPARGDLGRRRAGHHRRRRCSPTRSGATGRAPSATPSSIAASPASTPRTTRPSRCMSTS